MGGYYEYCGGKGGNKWWLVRRWELRLLIVLGLLVVDVKGTSRRVVGRMGGVCCWYLKQCIDCISQ